MFKLFDAHTHVQFSAFEKDYKVVIDRALTAGIGIINVGTQIDTSRRAIEVAHEYPEGVYATVGLHPTHTSRSYHDSQELGGGESAKSFTSRGEEFDYAKYLALAKDPKVIAIGECGLDYFRATSNPMTSDVGQATWKTKQEEAFRAQIELAKEVQKPLMIHCRPSFAKDTDGQAPKRTDDAYEDALNILKTYNSKLKTIFHFYAGSPEMTRKLLDFGAYFTFGGVVTFVRDYDASIALIPLDRIMLETDAPYVAPVPYRGKRNEPSYIVEVAKKMAELKGVEFDAIAKQTTENTKRVFRI